MGNLRLKAELKEGTAWSREKKCPECSWCGLAWFATARLPQQSAYRCLADLLTQDAPSVSLLHYGTVKH